MHIVHVTPYYAPAYAFGGVVRAVEGMAGALVKRGHTVTVLTTDALTRDRRYPGAADESIGGVRVIRAHNVIPRLRALNLSTPPAMHQIAHEVFPSADVIHIHELRTAENLLVLPVAKTYRKPAVLSPHGTLTWETGRSNFKQGWDRVFTPILLPTISAIIGLTRAETDDAHGMWTRLGGSPIPFFTIPNGVNPAEFADLQGGDAFRERWKLGSSTVCLFMGRLHPRKGVDVLIHAFKRANVPNTRLVIAGPDEGFLAQLQPLLDERIIVTGYLGGADRLDALAAADVFALPAIGEGLSMASLEALAAGVPVLLSPGCNLPEVITSYTGMVADIDGYDFAWGLQRLLLDNAMRRHMRANARRLIASRFTWDRVAAALESIYAQMMVR